MLTKFFDALRSKLATQIVLILLTGAISANGVVMTLGKASIENYTESIKDFTISIETTVSDISDLKAFAVEVRFEIFKFNVDNVKKQAGKIANDKEDIKPTDMVNASDFCASDVFKSMVLTIKGTERLLVNQSCKEVESWILNSNV